MLDHLRQEKHFVPVICIVAALIIISGMWLFSSKTSAYAVVLNGKQKFAVKDRNSVDRAIREITRENEAKIDSQSVQIATAVKITPIMASHVKLLPAGKVKSRLRQELQFTTSSEAIIVNDKTVTYVASKAVAGKLLNDLKKEFSHTGAGEKLVAVGFEEKIMLHQEKVTLSKVKTEKQAFNLLTSGCEKPDKYQVMEGDTLWSIARANDMYVDDIMKANHLKSEDLQLGQKLILLKSQPYINVIARVEGTRVETIPFATQVVIDKSSPYSVKVKQAGQNGEKQVAYTNTICNGIISQTQSLGEKVIKAAVDKIVVKGSRTTMVASRGGSYQGSGRLMWPASGPITQSFSSVHSGIDIGASYGSTIRAASGGIVVFAGVDGGYGNFIIINHGNGIITRYAHCSSLLVSAGQRVAAGQAIGRVGSTGHSTGPHLHFEVVAGGSFRNPLGYLN